LPQHGQQVVLPFPVHHVVGDEGDRLPPSLRVDSASGYQDMKVCVVVAGSTGGLQDDDGADVEIHAGGDAEDVLHAGIAGPHERAKEGRISIEPRVQVIWG